MQGISKRNSCVATVLFAMIAAAVLGCGQEGPKIVNVSGRATRGGRPVKDLKVTFMPESGRPSWGYTDPDGRYTLHYTRGRDGACVGKHRVFVKYDPRPSDPDEQEEWLAGGLKIPPDMKAIDKKYGDPETTPLEFDIQEDQVIDLKLD
jgi:hypothetical protein